MKIVIIEDSAEDAKLLKQTLEEYAKKNGQKMSVASYPCPGDYLKAGIEKPDALFLDIDMPGMSGMEFAKKIRAENDETIIVFVTNMVQYALDGYSVDVTDFLLKPVTYAGVERGMKKVLSRLGKRKAFLVPISDVTGKTLKYLSAADIQYVESSGHKVIYHTINGDITEWSRLQNMEEKLPADSFARSHVSFLINLDKVKSLDGDTVTLKDGAANLPVSRSQKKNFYARLAKYLGEKR